MKRPFPMLSLLVEGKPCLVIGGQREAEQRVKELQEAGALLRIVTKRCSEALFQYTKEHQLSLSQRELGGEDLEGVFFVVNTARDPVLAQKVFLETREKHCLLATLDDPLRSDVAFPAVVRSGLLRVGISTGGASPAFAKKLREELESLLAHPQTERLLRWLEEKRAQLQKTQGTFEARANALRRLLDGFSLRGSVQYPSAFLQEDREDL